MKKQFIHNTNNNYTSKIFEQEIIEYWNEDEILEGERIYNELIAIYETQGIDGIKNIDEGLLKKIIGGAAGFVIGPSIGKVIAKVLGIEKGILYDLFTSRLVGVALGSAITKYITGKKK